MIKHLLSISGIRKWRVMLQPFIFLMLILSCSMTDSTAQDGHYWAQQYGANSTLMAGSMVGGVNDNSAVYYNPAALAFIDNPSLSIDANVYKIDRIIISNGAGEGMNLNSAQLSFYPQIISGMINLVKDKRLRISYAVLTRNHCNVLMSARYNGNQGDQSQTVANYVGVFDFINQLNEQWFGVGAGYLLSEKLSAGVTLFGSYRGQSYQLTNYVREINAAGSGYTYATKTNYEGAKYSTVRLLAKFGFSYFTDAFKFGLTMTTPSAGIYGTGSVQREVSNIVVSENPDDLLNNFIITDTRNKLSAGYKHPLSVAAGCDYQTSKTRIALSAEYFFKIGTYHILEPESEPFVYPPSLQGTEAADGFLHLENAARPVFNVAAGLSQSVYKSFSLLLGASTDFCNYDTSEKSEELLHGFGGLDMYHFFSGISYHKKKSALSLGFTYAISPDKQIPPYTVINQSPDLTANGSISSNVYAVVFGYTYYLAKFSE